MYRAVVPEVLSGSRCGDERDTRFVPYRDVNLIVALALRKARDGPAGTPAVFERGSVLLECLSDRVELARVEREDEAVGVDAAWARALGERDARGRVGYTC